MTTSGWIGVDLDGTLAEYHGWDNGKLGQPISAMVARVKAWLAQGIEVRIFTARASGMDIEMQHLIQAWCLLHIGQILPITATKDFAMIELWDDLCIQVEKNTGRRIDGKE